jgi:hypothetical protein
MRLLAVVNIVKGEPETARVFLQVLSKDLIYGRWARQTARRLRADPTLAGDPEIDRVRSVMLKEDLCDPRKEITFGKLMETLWRSCPDNRMAAAYQMADYLLTREVGDVVRMVDAGRVKEMGHKSMPRHYAEAVLLHEQMTGQRPRLHGMSLDPYRDDLARFRMLRMRDNGRGELLAAELARELPNSYMRYYETGQSGGRHE